MTTNQTKTSSNISVPFRPEHGDTWAEPKAHKHVWRDLTDNGISGGGTLVEYPEACECGARRTMVVDTQTGKSWVKQ